ncbi:MAG: hypothetical protein NUW08_02305 [Candidatus Uhrbacteria bacterium]|nr:hypothetical protein [Candidatus Uhrbacteria bacterium]
MKSIVPKPLWFVPIAALALLGAGCFSPAPEAPPMVAPTPVKPAPSAPTPSEPAPSEPSATSPTPNEPTVPTSPLAPIDDTWKTYTNGSLTFSFRYPTRGRYAPTWGVTFVKTDDAKMQDGCYQGDANPRQNAGTLFVGDKKFCVTRYEDAGAGQRGLTDFYAVEQKGTIVLIAFSKQFANGDNFEDESCHGKLVVASGTSCTPVDIGVYNATLDQIVGTFQETE